MNVDGKLVNFASILEDQTRAQAVQTSSMPFIFPHLALMPDAHLGKGSTVGSVIPTLGAIMPAAVGVDIGCGMMAVRTPYKLKHFTSRGKTLASLREQIEIAIPASAGGYNRELSDTAKVRTSHLGIKAEDYLFDPADYTANWRLQLGTLGSGNHFIELSTDHEDNVWAFLHSGSRGIGNKIAMKHIKVAQAQCEKRYITLPDPNLAYLIEGEPEFWAYIREMTWAQEFAAANRAEMMDRVLGTMAQWLGVALVDRQVTINCHHNYTTQERHFKKNVWLSRKGAIDASAGTWGLIPGSMGTASYVVQGKGNHMALNSAPHGAGRVYSRNVAKKTFSHDDLRFAMRGIEYRDTDAFRDEHPGAYKDIDVVMHDARDLVEIVTVLKQFINVKGD